MSVSSCIHVHVRCMYVCMCISSLLPGNQILTSKYLARRGVVVSGGGAMDASSAPRVWNYNYYVCVCVCEQVLYSVT